MNFLPDGLRRRDIEQTEIDIERVHIQLLFDIVCEQGLYFRRKNKSPAFIVVIQGFFPSSSEGIWIKLLVS